MKPELEKLLGEGWELVTYFGECELYSNGNERILYDPVNKEVVMRYDYKEDTE